MQTRSSKRGNPEVPPAPPPVAKPAPKPKASLLKAIEKKLPSADIIKLIDEGADINEKDGKIGMPVLFYTIIQFVRYQGVFKKLIEKGVNINVKVPDLTNYTALHFTIKSTLRLDIKTQVLQLLVDAGADVNAQDQNGDTPAHVVAELETIRDPIPILEILIGGGANLQLLNRLDRTVYITAMLERRATINIVNILKYLESKGVDPSFGSNLNILTLASGYRDSSSDLLNHLIDIGIDVNTGDQNGMTPLLFAANHVRNNVIDKLLDHGADVKRKSVYGYGVLRYYFYGSLTGVPLDYNTVKKLLEKGASVHTLFRVEPYPESLLQAIKRIFTITPEMQELLCNYADPSNPDTLDFCPMPEVIDETPYKGFTKSDIELFNRFFDNPPDFSFCPVCLMVAFRTDGCMYMKHTCKKPYHTELYNLYQVGGKIEWCTLCGRITNGQHHHYVNSLPTGTVKPALAQVVPSPDFRFFDKDCKASGGGGNEEKVRRIHRLLGYACQLQDSVGKMLDYQARKELVEEVWLAASSRNRDVPVILEKKDFGFPCVFPEDAKPETTPEEVFPDILRPADEKDLVPIRHDPPDNTCVVELGVHEDNRPVWQFQHKQPDGTINKHEGKFICAEDLEATIRSNVIDGRCFDPACRAKIYPEELKDIVSPEFYEVYRTNFNRANAKQSGSGADVQPLLRLIEAGDAMCTAIRKPRGGRRTYRRRVRKTVKRRSQLK